MDARERVSVPGTESGVRQAMDALDAWSDQLPALARRRLLTAMDEILSNVVRHGLKGRAGIIELTWSRAGTILTAEVADDAPPFNPLLIADPDTKAPLDAREPGGLGLTLVRGLADDVRYERRGHQNRLTITWRSIEEGD